MKRNSIATFGIIVLIAAVTLSISTTVFALTDEIRPVQQSGLPQIIFLGEGPQTFNVEDPREFLVKTYVNGIFLFETDPGPTYEATRGERVWTTDFVPDEPIRLFDEWKSYGNVPAGCVVNYVQIEDNLDTRRNTFYINGNVLQVVEQGMVTYGSFTVPEAGELTFFAEDSIGLIVTPCQTIQTTVPSSTPTSTNTTVPTATATATETATPTASVSPFPFETGTVVVSTTTPTAMSTPTATQPAPSATASATASATLSTPGVIILPSETPTLAPTMTSTPLRLTEPPSGSSSTATPTVRPVSPGATNTVPPAVIILVTATPISTPGAIPVTGGEPGPREIAAISLTIIGLFSVMAAAWWFLLRSYANGR